MADGRCSPRLAGKEFFTANFPLYFSPFPSWRAHQRINKKKKKRKRTIPRLCPYFLLSTSHWRDGRSLLRCESGAGAKNGIRRCAKVNIAGSRTTGNLDSFMHKLRERRRSVASSSRSNQEPIIIIKDDVVVYTILPCFSNICAKQWTVCYFVGRSGFFTRSSSLWKVNHFVQYSPYRELILFLSGNVKDCVVTSERCAT